MADPNPSPAPLLRILLVDDYVEIRDLLVTLLRRDGFEVDAAGDGASGWEAMRSKRYDLLITDNDMPVLSGLELVQRVRAIPDPLPVIVVSGFALPDDVDVETLLQPGAFIEKPFSFPVLRAKVRELMNGRMAGTNGACPATDFILPLQPEHGMQRDGAVARRSADDTLSLESDGDTTTV